MRPSGPRQRTSGAVGEWGRGIGIGIALAEGPLFVLTVRFAAKSAATHFNNLKYLSISRQFA